MAPEESHSGGDLESRLKSIEQETASLERKLREEDTLIGQEHGKLEVEHRGEIQAGNISVRLVSRDMMRLQARITQVYKRVVFIASCIGAVWTALYCCGVIRQRHSRAALFTTGQSQGIIERFWETMSRQELSLVLIVGAIVGAVAGFAVVWLVCRLIKWMLVDFYSSTETPLPK
jgi:hypothetical protein